MSSVIRADKSWGRHIPDWIRFLAEECDREESQNKVGKRLGRSGSSINQALGNRYIGDLKKLETEVRAILMRDTVACPVLGIIKTDQCQDNQRRSFSSVNPIRVRLSRTCPKCTNNLKNGGNDDQ